MQGAHAYNNTGCLPWFPWMSLGGKHLNEFCCRCFMYVTGLQMIGRVVEDISIRMSFWKHYLLHAMIHLSWYVCSTYCDDSLLSIPHLWHVICSIVPYVCFLFFLLLNFLLLVWLNGTTLHLDVDIVRFGKTSVWFVSITEIWSIWWNDLSYLSSHCEDVHCK